MLTERFVTIGQRNRAVIICNSDRTATSASHYLVKGVYGPKRPSMLFLLRRREIGVWLCAQFEVLYKTGGQTKLDPGKATFASYAETLLISCMLKILDKRRISPVYSIIARSTVACATVMSIQSSPAKTRSRRIAHDAFA